jgi:hypothetical protein
MDIDKNKLREFALWLLGIMAKTENELVAHAVVFTLLKSKGQFSELDSLLQKARDNPSPQLLSRQNETRETVERLLAEESPAEALLRFLQDWKPQGPIQ